MYFQHIDFVYKISYTDRKKENHEVSTNVVLHNYDFENVFLLPKFKFHNTTLSDYRKVNAFPYNNSFWENNEELKLIDQDNNNKLFYNNKKSLTNKNIFSSNQYMQKGLFEKPYIS